MMMSARTFDYEILEEVRNRWSPRAFDPHHPVKEEDLLGIMEAARYAPSCFNEQPWRYIVAVSGEEDYEKIQGVLNETNREWASRAPVLMIIASRKHFAKNGKENRWHLFDAGTSWGYLSLEAQRRGLHTHAMGGFSVERAREVFDIGDDCSIIAVVALGYYGNKEDLSPELLQKERPGLRKPTREILHLKGRMPTRKGH
jgi:nitroreductase